MQESLPYAIVDRSELVLHEGKLILAAPQSERILRQIEGRGFADEAHEGDWVPVHWGWACGVLTAAQRTQLERYTRHNLALANQTI